MANNLINVTSEIGRLRSVILHRPGRELLNITPDVMEELLFDEIPYLKMAQQEHDAFAQVLRDNGVEVFYLEKLAAEALISSEVREEFIKMYLDEAGIAVPKERLLVAEVLQVLDNENLVLKMMEGIRKTELPVYHRENLVEMVGENSYFAVKPMPNLYFTRDPFSFVGNGVSLNHMWSQTRRRETLFGKFIFQYHPLFAKNTMPYWYERELLPSVEGGDILVLSNEVLAIGISQRSKPQAVQLLAENLLRNNSGYKTIIALTIPQSHAFMHLDTVFTMVDKDLFTLHPQVDDTLQIYIMQLINDKLVTKQEFASLESTLQKYLPVDKIALIREGEGTFMDAVREQWNDGYNTLALAPREVVVYDRNTLTNTELEKHGAKLHIIKSGELSRGRGGPRCMSMPFYRDNVF